MVQMPPNLNEQQTWGGVRYRPPSEPPPTVTNERDQATLVARGRQETQDHPLSQQGVIASSSNNLFHPVPNAPSSYVFSLPKVLSNPRLRTYDAPNTFPHPYSYRSPFSSYNNPAFTVPTGTVGCDLYVT